jgi:Bacteriophage Rz lysis protein
MKYLYIFAFFLASLGGVYGVGHHNGYEEERLNVQGAIEEANASARMTEQKLNGKIADLSTQLVKVQDDAKKEIAKRDSAIATGKLQLYVKTKPTVCPSKDAPSTIGPDTATAQLDPTFAQSIVTITDDGDTAIRKLNACIATYNQVREMINGFTPTK